MSSRTYVLHAGEGQKVTDPSQYLYEVDAEALYDGYLIAKAIHEDRGRGEVLDWGVRR